MADGCGFDVRPALSADLPVVLALLADDGLGRQRESVVTPVPEVYQWAFADIEADPRNEFLVAVQGGRIVGCCQLTMIPGLSRRGAERAQIESVRISADLRGQGLGEAFMRAVIERARLRGASLVQLTSDAIREGAHRFYARLGFVPSHTGFKLQL